ncbi:benzoyl-CoA 2,3-epoxidase subunit BoxA, partial [Bradyrhizobium sp.]|uniref:benzoyl-CoA 2,3-epoxidase subunit BoxA n=1 Tax=Bradyrhizobium sp. TaxID=376 RepID=UPI00290FD77D
MNAPLKQHLIDPEICIRCNTCEETCPEDAITHDNNNYVVDATKCNFCMDCIQPCPTGSIDNWRIVAQAYSIDDQYSWNELPKQAELASGAEGEAVDAEVLALIDAAHTGAGGKSVAPASAAKPAINLYNRDAAAVATVTGNYRLTHDESDVDVHHVILDFADQPFPVLEGQSIGIVPPGLDADGKPHRIRLYSIASPRHGERPNTNNLALTVKREPNGVCSNYICDLKKGDKVQVTGPFGATFLMPNDPAANIIMICTGTGSAPFRGFTEWRRRAMPGASGRMMLFFGARRPQDLPYFGPLQKVPESLLRKHFAVIQGRI